MGGNLTFALVGACLLVVVRACVRACPWLPNSCARAHADISLELLLLISVVPALFALLLFSMSVCGLFSGEGG